MKDEKRTETEVQRRYRRRAFVEPEIIVRRVRRRPAVVYGEVAEEFGVPEFERKIRA